MAYAPPVLFTTTHNTNTHATYSNAPWAWARLVPQCLVNLSRPPAVATTRPPGGLSWVISSPALTGAGANHPPVMGGQLTFDALDRREGVNERVEGRLRALRFWAEIWSSVLFVNPIHGPVTSVLCCYTDFRYISSLS